jgi:hypothetical protein
VCFWEDDGLREPDVRSAVNRLTLAQARRNFAAFGACDPGLLHLVRPPTPAEIPPGR